MRTLTTRELSYSWDPLLRGWVMCSSPKSSEYCPSILHELINGSRADLRLLIIWLIYLRANSLGDMDKLGTLLAFESVLAFGWLGSPNSLNSSGVQRIGLEI